MVPGCSYCLCRVLSFQFVPSVCVRVLSFQVVLIVCEGFYLSRLFLLFV